MIVAERVSNCATVCAHVAGVLATASARRKITLTVVRELIEMLESLLMDMRALARDLE